MSKPPFDLSHFLPYRMAVLATRMSRLLSSRYETQYGLSMPEWRVLVHVARCEKVSVREIHKCVNLEKPTVSRAVSRLERDGRLAKVTSKQDQRLVEIELTAKGRALLDEIIPEALGVEQRLLERLSASERADLHRLMEKLHATLDEDPRAPRRSERDAGD